MPGLPVGLGCAGAFDPESREDFATTTPEKAECHGRWRSVGTRAPFRSRGHVAGLGLKAGTGGHQHGASQV